MCRFVGMFLTLLFCSFVFCARGAMEEIDGQLLLHVYHSLGTGPEPEFEPRGFITLQSNKNSESTYFQEKLFSEEDIAKLKHLADSDSFYRIKVVPSSGSEDVDAVFSFTKACAIYQSGLNDEIRIALDANGQLVGAAIIAIPSSCDADFDETSLQSHVFNTTVTILSTVNGPAPDTQTYIQRLDQEKAEKARGEKGDDRTFFAKYWMYIVPFVIFLFISGASGPDQQGGGGR